MNELNNNVNSSNNENIQIKCEYCGRINYGNTSVCSNCGRSLMKKFGCLVSSIMMFILSGFNLLALLFSAFMLWILGESASNSPLIILVLLFKFIRIVSVIGLIITLILGFVFLKKTKK